MKDNMPCVEETWKEGGGGRVCVEEDFSLSSTLTHVNNSDKPSTTRENSKSGEIRCDLKDSKLPQQHSAIKGHTNRKNPQIAHNRALWQSG